VIALSRLPLAATALLILLPGAAPAGAGSPTDNPDGRAPFSAPTLSGGAEKAEPADEAQPKGAQVLPLAPPDASTARGQERGNAALRAGENPRQGGAAEEGEGDSVREK
jgi:hypothetical protein